MNYRDDFREVQREAYWTFPRIAMFAVLGLAFLYFMGFLATGGDLFIYQFWAPKRANAERKVFENTQSYVEGKTEHLSRLRFEYEQAPAGPQKEALKRLILDEASTVDQSKLPPGLQAFIENIGGER